MTISGLTESIISMNRRKQTVMVIVGLILRMYQR